MTMKILNTFKKPVDYFEVTSRKTSRTIIVNETLRAAIFMVTFTFIHYFFGTEKMALFDLAKIYAIAFVPVALFFIVLGFAERAYAQRKISKK